ncbi:hypothetical protein HPG69_012766 [Diceros bicornis minor]|uniref:N-alpha-acetyltransferase 80 n=1 Tax=Diceros bicornis minor TaxID=77932 RepID=A0A7J7F1M4_DICBM|nr:hypothetical protein HPG69_012766 [Diceros bicornis minor]
MVRGETRRLQCVRRTARGQRGWSKEPERETARYPSVRSEDAEQPRARLQHSMLSHTHPESKPGCPHRPKPHGLSPIRREGETEAQERLPPLSEDPGAPPTVGGVSTEGVKLAGKSGAPGVGGGSWGSPLLVRECGCCGEGAPLWSEEMPLPGDCGLNPQLGTDTPATQQEVTLAPSLTQLSLDPTCRRELTLTPGPAKLTPTLDPINQIPAELTLDPACQPELTLRSNLAKLTLDPAHQPELTLSPRLAELTPGSTCHPEMTLCPGSTELTLEPVHCRPELLDACADLINEQWPRSRASRLHSLGQSSDAFPLCLMLLSPHPTPEAAPIVVGHARLSRVLDRPQSLLVETVVVARALRGRGFGRRLMEGLEVFAHARGFRRLHLTTHDQLHFYAHLGYQLGEPVQGLVFTSQRLPANLLSAFSRAPSPRPRCKAPSLTAQASPRAPKGPSLPPPPPLPEPLTTSTLPPAGSPPQSLLETQYQDLRGCAVFWMEKDI